MSADRPPVPPSQFADAPPVGGLSFDHHQRMSRDYRPWRKFRYIAEDLGVHAESAWAAVKASRRLLWRELPLARADGGRFGICVHPSLIRAVHLIDRASGDDMLSRSADGPMSSAMRKRLNQLFRGGELVPNRMVADTRMNEAAESSLIEGASATREQALDLLRSGRAPVSISERMIVNNYQAMQLVKQRLNAPLSIDLILELHDVLTDGTLNAPDQCGRFRLPTEVVRVIDSRDNRVIHTPPDAASIRSMVQSMCEFANADHGGEPFLHPVVVACTLHFLMGYIHPFVDGNGRSARAIFYWHALRHGYSIMEYLSISEIIRKGYARYPQAYVDTETDDGDLTYFVLYHLNVIEQALERFAEHLAREDSRVENSRQFLALGDDLNLRQRLVLEHAVRHPATLYTVKSHMNSNGISIITARTDLDDLVRRRLMVTSKRAREVIYHPAPDLRARLTRKSR